MGCHAWIYKKVTSFSKKELDTFLEKFIKLELRGCQYTQSKEEFVDGMFNTIKHKSLTKKMCGEIWEEAQKTKEKLISQSESFFKDDSAASWLEFVNILEPFNYRAHLKEHNGEWYYLISTDGKFRCHKCQEEPIDNLNDMMNYLDNCAPNDIDYYDPNNLTVIKGFSNEIIQHMTTLFKNKDVLVEFV